MECYVIILIMVYCDVLVELKIDFCYGDFNYVFGLNVYCCVNF